MAKRKTEPSPQSLAPRVWSPARTMGVARALNKSGYMTRREAELAVADGRVELGGETVTDPREQVAAGGEIVLDGEVLKCLKFQYLAFNKPLRVVCRTVDGPGNRLAADFLPGDVPGLRTAGRLDGRTSGLLLVSNDPVWISAVTSSKNLENEFRVQVEGELTDLELKVMDAGIHVPGLGVFRPLELNVIEIMRGQTVLAVTVLGGQIRPLRRMLITLRHRVTSLRRVRLGSIRLSSLAPGGLRPLTIEETRSVLRPPVRRVARKG